MNGAKNEASLADELQVALFNRDIAAGSGLLDQSSSSAGTWLAGTDVSSALLLCVAQWVDLGYRGLGFLESVEAAHPSVDWAGLPLLDYLKLRMVEAYRLLATDRLPEAIELLSLVLRVGDGILDDYHRFLANFWKGRAHRKLGGYQHAAENFTSARLARRSLPEP